MQPAKAHWVNRDTIGLRGAEPGDTYRLYFSPTGGINLEREAGLTDRAFIPLSVDPHGFPESVVDKNPFLKGATALKIPAADLARVPALLKGQLVLAKFNGIQPADATALQIWAVLDDLFYFGGELGARQCGNGICFRLWAPTAQAVRLLIYDDPNGPIQTIHSMTEGDVGVWEMLVEGTGWLNRKYYLYEVRVFSRQEGRVTTNLVTDPYSLGLSADSLKSLVVDLNSPLTKPIFWNSIPKPPLASPTDVVLYELHIRDFSISDNTVPEKDRGKYTGFTHLFSRGMTHLWRLASAGLTHVHLLPAFDFATVPELTSDQKVPEILVPISAPDSAQPQAAIATVKDQDGFNWGYDPYHYGTPEGSYSTSPAGPTRIREFREMVKSFHLSVCAW